jgi:hypothetical protein
MPTHTQGRSTRAAHGAVGAFRQSLLCYLHKQEHKVSSYCDAVEVCCKRCGADLVFILIEYYCRFSCDAVYFAS